MKNCNASEKQTTRRILLIASIAALAVAQAISLSQPAQAHIARPGPPANIPTELPVLP